METVIPRNHRSPAPTPPDLLRVPPGMTRSRFRAMGTTISLLVPAGNVQMMLQGQSGGGDDNSLSITSSRVAILSSAGQQLFSGSLSNINQDRRLYMKATLSGTGTNSRSWMQVMITVGLAASGQVTGTITAGKAIPAGSGASE